MDKRFGTSLARHVALLILLVVTAGCGKSNDPRPMLADYLQRVKNITDSASLPEEDSLTLPAWPSARDRRMSLPTQTASVADWFRLRDCELFGLINERNSILGRVQEPSQRLLYELRFLQLVPNCLDQLASGGKGALLTLEKLNSVAQTKAKALPAIYWNATIAGDEFAAMVGPTDGALIMGDDKGSSATQAALQFLSQLAKAVDAPLMHQVEASSYEMANREISISEWAGQLHQSQRLLITSLNQAAAMLEQRMAKKRLCLNQRPNRKAEIFRNVFQRYYAAAVQPYMAQVQQQKNSWQQAMLPLLTPVAAEQRPELVKAWLKAHLAVDGVLQTQYRAALERHTKAWQALLGQCGMMPGSRYYAVASSSPML